MYTRSIAVTFAASCIAACAGGAPEPNAPPRSAAAATTAASQTPRDARLATLDAMKRADEAKDAHAVAALYAEDAVVDLIGGKTLHGRREIEDNERKMMEPASQLRLGFGRAWLTGDVAIAEIQFEATLPPGGKARAVGATALSVLWFAPNGQIQKEHFYMNQGTLEEQASGEPDALPIPPIPTSTEVHVAGDAREAQSATFATQYMAAQSRSDADALALMNDDVAWSCVLGFSGKAKSDLQAPLKHFRDGFPDMKWTATNAWSVEDYVIVEEKMSATHKGKFASFEPSGRPVSWRWAEILQVKNGRIVRGWSYTNFRDVIPSLTGSPAQVKVKTPCAIEP